MQVDEFTDATEPSLFLAFVRCYTEEQILTCKLFSAHTAGGDIFNVTDLYVAEND
jgi:hypothetical protein